MNQKVISFEHHVNEVLKPKLNDYLSSRDKIIEEQAEYLRLEETVSKLAGKKELRTKVDLGCNFFVQAEIDDCSKINVHLGSGLYAELSHEELFQFCKKKRNLLKKKEEFQTDIINELKSEIRLVLEGIRELQNLPMEEDKSKRRIFNF